MRRLQSRDHTTHRAGLRVLGTLLAIAGGVFTAIGLVSFFGAMQGGGPPRYFWCAFVGLPMLALGFGMLKLGHLGTIARYVATETTPVAADALHDLAQGTHDAVRGTARAFAAGMRDAHSAAAAPCGACRAPMAADARFCSQCGEPRASTAGCAACGRANAPDARFCAGCGQPLAAR